MYKIKLIDTTGKVSIAYCFGVQYFSAGCQTSVTCDNTGETCYGYVVPVELVEVEND